VGGFERGKKGVERVLGGLGCGLVLCSVCLHTPLFDYESFERDPKWLACGRCRHDSIM
jgi:hypothetical protein